MDRYTALQVFRHVAELGSFAEAGRKLGLSPAAISKNVAELEASVGARLINRTTRRMALTDEGKLYLEHVVRGLDALKDADAALSPIRQTPGGTLRVAAPMTVTLMRLSSVIPSSCPATRTSSSICISMTGASISCGRDSISPFAAATSWRIQA